jgi:hypothetical protein
MKFGIKALIITLIITIGALCLAQSPIRPSAVRQDDPVTDRPKPPKPKRPIITKVVDGRRVSIFEADDGSWMRVTVPADPRRTGPDTIEKGIYDHSTGSFIEWSEVGS